MTTRAITYRDACRELIAQARAELEAGDLRQASEKAWGAAAQMAKAAASSRGWDHDQHRNLWTSVKDLTNEAGDQEIHDLFVSANGLHVNFYENTYTAQMVGLYMGRVEQFIAKVDDILDDRGVPQ